VRLLTQALTTHDVDAVVRLLAEDVRMAMRHCPPSGRRDGRRRSWPRWRSGCARARFVQTRANGQPALAVYSHDAVDGLWRAGGLLVVTLDGGQITSLTRFESPRAPLRAAQHPPEDQSETSSGHGIATEQRGR